jgi:hypothetical protein
MKKLPHIPSDDAHTTAPHYASFILRCWQDAERVRARLIDVSSGATYPVTDLDVLPEMVARLLRNLRLDPSLADDNAITRPIAEGESPPSFTQESE